MGSFEERKKGFPVVQIEAGRATVVKIMLDGLCVKEDIVRITRVDWKPETGECDIKYENLNHLLSKNN